MQEILPDSLCGAVSSALLEQNDKMMGREGSTEEGLVEGESSESAIANTSYFNSEESISWQTSSQNVRS